MRETAITKSTWDSVQSALKTIISEGRVQKTIRQATKDRVKTDFVDRYYEYECKVWGAYNSNGSIVYEVTMFCRELNRGFFGYTHTDTMTLWNISGEKNETQYREWMENGFEDIRQKLLSTRSKG